MTFPVDMVDLLASMEDLEEVQTALSRETTIRRAMASSGEDRQTIIEMIDAIDSMDQEAVLSLTEGEPTTLIDALGRYVDRMDSADLAESAVRNDLGALLAYPWSEEEATIATHGANASVKLRVELGEHRTAVMVGDFKVADIPTQDPYVKAVTQDVAEAVHRAVLARVIGDREHIVQLNASETTWLKAWLTSPNGSHPTGVDDRLTVEAMSDGGLLVRTRPYTHVTPPRSR